MKVLITGATGLIGSALVQKCLAKGYSINYLTTRKSKIEHKNNYNGFFWNPSKNEIDIKAFEGVDTIINLAGSSISKRWTDSYKEQIIDSRLDSLNTIFKTIEENDLAIKQLISSSAIGYYPDSKTTYYSENFVSNSNDFLSSVVQQWEAATLPFEKLGINVSCIRTGIVLAENDGALPKLVSPIEKYVGAALGTGEQWQSWIHIDDIVGIYMHLLETNAKGIYNGVAPNPVTQKYLTKAIAKTLNKPLIPFNVPTLMLKLILGEMHVIVTQGQRVSAEKIIDEGYDFKFHDVHEALQNLLT